MIAQVKGKKTQTELTFTDRLLGVSIRTQNLSELIHTTPLGDKKYISVSRRRNKGSGASVYAGTELVNSKAGV